MVGRGFEVAVSFLSGSHWSWPSFASVALGAAEAAYRHVADGLPKRPTPYDSHYQPKPLREAIAAALRGAPPRKPAAIAGRL